MPQRTTIEVNGLEIRRIRKLSGLEMGDLALRVGISTNYLSRIETGSRKNLRPGVYAALRQALGTTDDAITTETEGT
jgi:transcriptional regulator with XRE-family HTH domain